MVSQQNKLFSFQFLEFNSGKKKYLFSVNKEEQPAIASLQSVYYFGNKIKKTFMKNNMKFKSNYLSIIV